MVFPTATSLGGGTATLIALRAQAAGLAPELVTVAGPRLGNAAFAAHFREQCSEAVHLYHDDDDVLKSNRELWDNLGFEHVGREVRVDKRALQQRYTPCGLCVGCMRVIMWVNREIWGA